MDSFKNIINRFKNESSLLFVSLLIAGVIVLLREPASYVGAGLVFFAVFVGIFGFFTNSICENYENILSHKDYMIKMLIKERKTEIKHSEDIRKSYESKTTGDWEVSSPEFESN